MNANPETVNRENFNKIFIRNEKSIKFCLKEFTFVGVSQLTAANGKSDGRQRMKQKQKEAKIDVKREENQFAARHRCHYTLRLIHFN